MTDIWYYDPSLKKPFLHSGSEKLIQNLAARDLHNNWVLTPIYFFAELVTND